MWKYAPYAISIFIAVASLWDTLRTPPNQASNPSWFQKSGPKVLTLVLGLVLLFVQAKSSSEASTKANADATDKLRQALADQREQLTGAFKSGTDQVIKAANAEADQTRKDAASQTVSIKKQASEQVAEVQGFALGTKKCPSIIGRIHRPSGRPDGIVIFNLDNKLNMYDLNVALIEWGPGPPGGPWSTVLQRKAIDVPLITPESATEVPFQFLSPMTDIDVQITLSTRALRCNGRVDLYDTGNDVWLNDNATMASQDGKLAYQVGEKRSPGLVNSKLDPSFNP